MLPVHFRPVFECQATRFHLFLPLLLDGLRLVMDGFASEFSGLGARVDRAELQSGPILTLRYHIYNSKPTK
jgi:hypothetical protein